MNKCLYILCFFIFSFSIQATAIIDNETVVRHKNCFEGRFATFENWQTFISNKIAKKIENKDMRVKRLAMFERNFKAVDFKRFKNNLECQSIKYMVDGHQVSGFVVKPKNTNGKLPVLIYNRGGNGNFGAVVFAALMRNIFPVAEQGFIIIGSQYRGTLTKNKTAADEFGGKDVDDVVALFDLIQSITAADAERIGMFGASRGGMQSYLTLKRTNKVKAVAVIAGKSDAIVGLKQRPNMEAVYRKRIPNYEQNKQVELEKRSVLYWLDKIPQNVPILLLHGMSDERVSVEQSISLAEALEKAGMPHKLVLYPGDNHGLTQNKVKATQEIVTWFNKHL